MKARLRREAVYRSRERTMPKMKTHSGAKKRFSVTGSGKIRRLKAYKSHILTKKDSKRKRNLRRPTIVTTNGEVKRIKRLILA
jgi:large subunit ribosomal protein L35